MFVSKMYLPEEHLQKWIKAFWIVEGTGNGAMHQYRLIPDGCATLVFILGGSLSLPFYQNKEMTYGAYIIPPNTQPHENMISDDIFHIDIQLNPGVFYKLFKIPVCLLENRVYDFSELSIPFNPSVLEELALCRYDRKILLARLNMFVFNLFSPIDFKTDILLTGVAQLYKDGDIDRFFAQQSLSIRQLQRNVKTLTGIGPKSISRISRFYNALEEIKNKPADVKFSYHNIEDNFSDQSHFIREFKSFAGFAPIQFIHHSEEFLQYTGLCRYHKSVS